MEKLEKRMKAAKIAKERIDSKIDVSDNSKSPTKDQKETIRNQIQDMYDLFNRMSLFYLRGDNSKK